MAIFSGLPKIELHVHLDCSLSYRVVKRLDPSVSYDDYRSNFIAPYRAGNLDLFLRGVGRVLDIMQSPDQLRAVVGDLFEQLSEDNVRYVEIRFAPLLHTRGGLTAMEVVDVVSRAVDYWSLRFRIPAGIILCIMREFPESSGVLTTEIAIEFREKNVVAIDLVGNENAVPASKQRLAFDLAFSEGIPRVAHAGETAGASSVWDVLEVCRPCRIGHGIRSLEDSNLVDHLKAERVHLEICPTSNVRLGVCQSHDDHPIRDAFQRGVSVSIGTDGRMISDTDLNREYELLGGGFGWDCRFFNNINISAVEASFASLKVKASLMREFSSSEYL